MNIDTARSYATEANLVTALDRLGYSAFRPLIVRNRAGRFTAIFGFAMVGHHAQFVARAGFPVIN